MRQSPRASISSSVRREMPESSDNALIESPRWVRSVFRLSIFIAPIQHGASDGKHHRKRPQSTAQEEKQIIAFLLDGAGQGKNQRSIQAKVFGKRFENLMHHIAALLFLNYNKGEPSGAEVPPRWVCN